MTSIYQEILGPAFDRLHPQIQKRFGFSSTDGVAAIGTGVMQNLWHGRFYTLPFLYIGSWRRIMFPERGTDVPFTIRNYAYRDGFGRETVTWIRTFQTSRPRRFDAYMIHSRQRGRIVDYLGTHQHLAVDIDLSVDERGGLRLRSGDQRFYEGPIFSNVVLGDEINRATPKTQSAFIEAVDRLLYRAKQQGRNRLQHGRCDTAQAAPRQA